MLTSGWVRQPFLSPYTLSMCNNFHAPREIQLNNTPRILWVYGFSMPLLFDKSSVAAACLGCSIYAPLLQTVGMCVIYVSHILFITSVYME